MITLSKENIPDYLKKQMPYLDFSRPLIISEIGEGSEEDDGDGYVNFVFRVSDGKLKLILKQARKEGRVAKQSDMPMERTSMEYDYMKIGSVIVPEYMPKLFFYDDENLAFAVEDVSHLKIARFQLNKSVIFPKMAEQLAEYLAKMHFYTSDYYLDTETFRKLQIRFSNSKMREIFEKMAFANRDCGAPEGLGFELDPKYASFIRNLVLDPQVVLERHKLRELYMGKAEVLLHADFHTSNFFVDQEQLKVIDMEFAFFGPAGYDLGYLMSHLVSQFACSAFRHFDSEEERLAFASYLVATMKHLFEEYCRVFFECWEQDAKSFYKTVPGIQEYIQQHVLHDTIGFCANANFFRCASETMYPEYDHLEDAAKRKHAIVLTLLMDHHMILHRNEYQNVQQWLDDLLAILQEYLAKM